MKKFIVYVTLGLSILCALIYNVPVEQKEVILLGNLVSINAGLESEEYIAYNKKVQTSIRNVGVITCIDMDTKEFVTLGHPISTDESNLEGICYQANYVSVQKPTQGKAGSIYAGVAHEQYGKVTKNTMCGIYGNASENLLKENPNLIKIASKFEVRYGDAEIKINLDGEGLKTYKVEIVGIDYFSENQNINVKIVDENLIKLTGGIVKGMSGTPLIQNGKLIGAINYVSGENSLDAYAVFADKLF